MSALIETKHTGCYIVEEFDEGAGLTCREVVTIGNSQDLVPGTVLGKIATDTGAVTVGAPAGPTVGDGSCTRANPAYGDGVQEGTYRVICVEKTANLGSFQVIRPDGTVDGVALVGAAYDGQIKFTIADGGTDFEAATSIFTLAVSIANDAQAGRWVAHNPDAGTEGENVAAGILFAPVKTAANTTATAVAHVRGPLAVRAADLTWKTDISAPNKAAGIAALTALGIILR